MNFSSAQRLGGVRRFVVVTLTSLVAMVGVQSMLSTAYAACPLEDALPHLKGRTMRPTMRSAVSGAYPPNSSQGGVEH
jgi:hypothetical protein